MREITLLGYGGYGGYGGRQRGVEVDQASIHVSMGCGLKDRSLLMTFLSLVRDHSCLMFKKSSVNEEGTW